MLSSLHWIVSKLCVLLNLGCTIFIRFLFGDKLRKLIIPDNASAGEMDVSGALNKLDKLRSTLTSGVTTAVFSTVSTVKDVLPGNPVTRDFEVRSICGLNDLNELWKKDPFKGIYKLSSPLSFKGFRSNMLYH